MPLQTSEIRYFFPADHPLVEYAPVLCSQWGLQEQAPRTDQYLQLAEAATAGLKLREGRLELKLLVRAVMDNQPAFEQWEKWDLGPSTLALPKTIEVDKSRWLAYYDQKLQPAQAGERSPLAGIEWSEIHIMGQRHYSFCLEVEGEQATDRETLLHRTWQALHEQSPDLTQLLIKESPCSYPCFLLKQAAVTPR